MIAWLALFACGRGPDAADLGAVGTRDPDVVRFVAVGDAGRDTPHLHAVAAAVGRVCADRGCDLGLLLGDNLYDTGLESADDPRLGEVTAPLRATGIPWYLVHGNHDYAWGGDLQRAAWARAWADRTEGVEHPTPWYRFEAGPAAFVALDTTWAFWWGASPQLAWLHHAPATTARWRVVFGHHPLRSNGEHGNAGAYEGWVNLPFASGRPVRDLLEGAVCPAADLYLSGHDHDLQLLDGCGATLVVSGAGAGARPLVGRGNRASFERAIPGFAWVELGATGRVVFFDAEGTLLHESGAIDPRAVLY